MSDETPDPAAPEEAAPTAASSAAAAPEEAAPLMILLAEYDDPEAAGKDFETIKAQHDLNHFKTFNCALIEHRGKDHEGKPKIIRYEESTTRGMAIGAAAGLAVGLVFPPAVVGTVLVGTGTGGLIAHGRHGSDEDVLKALAEALPDEKSYVVVSTTDVDQEQTIRGYLAEAVAIHKGSEGDDAATLQSDPT
ncbi:MAG: DUF1269 domain-containing protein [Candidatus Nanopelagicales bacterium]